MLIFKTSVTFSHSNTEREKHSLRLRHRSIERLSLRQRETMYQIDSLIPLPTKTEKDLELDKQTIRQKMYHTKRINVIVKDTNTIRHRKTATLTDRQV